MHGVFRYQSNRALFYFGFLSSEKKAEISIKKKDDRYHYLHCQHKQQYFYGRMIQQRLQIYIFEKDRISKRGEIIMGYQDNNAVFAEE